MSYFVLMYIPSSFDLVIKANSTADRNLSIHRILYSSTTSTSIAIQSHSNIQKHIALIFFTNHLIILCVAYCVTYWHFFFF
jgi:hypothetical protein